MKNPHPDLKLIDELLMDIKDLIKTDWEGVEFHSHATMWAMQRLREAWKSGEMKLITLSLANYFKKEQ